MTFPLLLLLLLPGQVKVEILNADEMVYTEAGIRRLIGNVHLVHEGTNMKCDSAYQYVNENKVYAFGHVRITREGTSATADSLRYDGLTKKAVLLGRVNLTDGKMSLETTSLDYDMETDIASYYDSARITDGMAVLSSRRGHYHSGTQQSFFRERVALTHPDYSLKSDTLQYSHPEEKAWFHGPTRISSGDAESYCEGGWYETRTKRSLFTGNAWLVRGAQRIYGDSLIYDQLAGTGWAESHVRWEDTAEHIAIEAGRASFRESDEYILAAERPVMIHFLDGDSLYLGADTLVAWKDTGGYRVFHAFRHVKIFKSDLQGACDSVAYSYRDSVLRMYHDPVLWSGSSQMTADTVSIIMSGSRITRIDMLKSAFLASRADSLLFNQVKGKNTFGYFRDSHLARMHVEGNGESIYYGQDENDAYIGVNRIACSNMMIYFDDDDVSRVAFLKRPDATFYPIQQADVSEFLLKGFRWLEERRPGSREEVISDQ